VKEEARGQRGGTLGTFAGVFTPSILTILGLILFLRVGYVVGAAGILRALWIILLANAISVLTSISLSTIATNLRVKGGGDYYLISRTLGVEFGGALGLVLFLAQAVSIAFYAIGFGEGVASILPEPPAWSAQAIAAGAVAILFVLAWLGADVATKFQYAVMAILFTAIAAFLVSGLGDFQWSLLRRNLTPSSDDSFWPLFAIFFPAVTGFTQGVSMSGDLKDPARSLPLGTFLAVGLSAAVYVSVAMVFAGTLPGEVLVADYSAMRRVSLAPWLVDAGVIAATLSSALASFLGGPRILQSLAADRVFRWLQPFAEGYGPSHNPRRGVLLAAAIAFATIALGKLDLIAPVVTMFFLVSYGLLNYATYFVARTNSPSFRPTFRYFHPLLSLLGGLACLGAMLAIHPAAALAAVGMLFGIFQFLRRTVEVERWADSSRSHLFHVVRQNLHKLSSELEHPSDWRPVLLAFSDDPQRRERLMRFAQWIEGRAGLTTVVSVIEADGAIGRKRRDELQTALSAELRQRELDAFALAVTAGDRGEAVGVLLQSFGLGPVKVNTVLLNWFDHQPAPDAPPGLQSYSQYLRTALRFGCNLVILDATADELAAMEAIDPEQRRIDVWFVDEVNGQLMLLLAHLMTRSPEWREATIRALVAISDNMAGTRTEDDVSRMLSEFRIDAEPCMIERLDRESVVRHSRDAALVFLPFRLRGDNPACVFEASLEDLIHALPLTVLVLAAQDIDLDAEPEQGRHQQIAAAVDAAAEARAKATKADQEAEQAKAKADKLRAELDQARRAGADQAAIETLESELNAAEASANDLKRRAAKSQAKAEAAAQEADAITGRTRAKDDVAAESRSRNTDAPTN